MNQSGSQGCEQLESLPAGLQVRKRCSWLLQFSSTVLAKLPGTPQDPYGGQIVDANALGPPCRQAPLPCPVLQDL